MHLVDEVGEVLLRHALPGGSLIVLLGDDGLVRLQDDAWDPLEERLLVLHGWGHGILVEGVEAEEVVVYVAVVLLVRCVRHHLGLGLALKDTVPHSVSARRVCLLVFVARPGRSSVSLLAFVRQSSFEIFRLDELVHHFFDGVELDTG